MGGVTSSNCGYVKNVPTGRTDFFGKCKCFNSHITGAACNAITHVLVSLTEYPANSIDVRGKNVISATLRTDIKIGSLKKHFRSIASNITEDMDFFVTPQHGAMVLDDDKKPLSAYITPKTTTCDTTQCTLYMGVQKRGVCAERMSKQACQSGFDYNAVKFNRPTDQVPSDAKPGMNVELLGLHVEQGMAWTCDWCGDAGGEHCELTRKHSNVSYDIVGGLEHASYGDMECQCVMGEAGAFQTREACKAAMQMCVEGVDGYCENCVKHPDCVFCSVRGDGIGQCRHAKMKNLLEVCNPNLYRIGTGENFPPDYTDYPSICHH